MSEYPLILIMVFLFSTSFTIWVFGVFSIPSLFLYSLTLFQILPLLYALITGFYPYDLTRQTNMLTIGIVGFMLGYLPLGLARVKALRKSQNQYLERNTSRSIFKAALLFSLALLPVTAVLALNFFLTRRTGQYGLTEPLSSLEQLFFYAALSFFCIALSVNLRHIPYKWIFLLTAIVILPRLLVSLVYSRIFIFLALLPLFYALYFSRLNYSLAPIKATTVLFVLGLFVILPALTRDSSIVASQQRFEALIMNGSSIPILEKYERYEIQRDQSYVFASVVLKAIPFPIPVPENYRVDVWGLQGAVATLDRVLSSYENQNREVFYGTGSNYLHELFIDFGWPGVVLGSLLLGFTVSFLEYKSVSSFFFRFAWLSILTSFLFLPRSNVGYFLEKLPLFIAFYVLFWLAVKLLSESGKSVREYRHES